MGTILLKLAGPLQAWGAESRFTERKTRHEPTKSGVVGLVAAALGRRREDPIDDLASYKFGVRIDQPGKFERDFQTAHTQKFDSKQQTWVFDKSLPLSNRYFLSDAVFVAGIELPDDKLPVVADAMLRPAFPLYLGRRSCPPSEKVLLDAMKGINLMDALSNHPWEASSRLLKYRNRECEYVRCEILRDVLPTDDVSARVEMVRDVPLSFSQEQRLYDWRTVVHTWADVRNPFASAMLFNRGHDPMAILGEA